MLEVFGMRVRFWSCTWEYVSSGDGTHTTFQVSYQVVGRVVQVRFFPERNFTTTLPRKERRDFWEKHILPEAEKMHPGKNVELVLSQPQHCLL